MRRGCIGGEGDSESEEGVSRGEGNSEPGCGWG